MKILQKSPVCNFKTLFILCLFCLNLITGVNGAELRGRVGVGGNFSLGFPLGDFASTSGYRAKVGLGAGLYAEYFYRDNISFGIIFELQSFKNKTGDSLSWFPGRPVRWDFGEARVFGKYIFSSTKRFSPFAEVSLGGFKLQWLFNPDGSETAAKYQLKPGVSLGGGFFYQVNEDIFLQTSLSGNYIFCKNAKAPLIGYETKLEKDIYFIAFKIGIVFLLGG